MTLGAEKDFQFVRELVEQLVDRFEFSWVIASQNCGQILASSLIENALLVEDSVAADLMRLLFQSNSPDGQPLESWQTDFLEWVKSSKSDPAKTLLVLQLENSGFPDYLEMGDRLQAIAGRIGGILVIRPDGNVSSGVRNRGSSMLPGCNTVGARYSLERSLRSKGSANYVHGTLPVIGERATEAMFVLGQQMLFPPGVYSIRALAVIPFFDEYDIIESTIGHLLSQGFSVHLLDDSKGHRGVKYVSELFSHDQRVSVEPFFREHRGKNWKEMLERISEIAQTPDFDWVVHVDADEELASSVPGLSVLDLLQIADSNGYNVVDFTRFDFLPTVESAGMQGSLDFGRFHRSPANLPSERAFKSGGVLVDHASSGGHRISLPGKRLFPFNLVLKHFPFRSAKHARKKIKSRRSSGRFELKRHGWHSHYFRESERPSYLWERSELEFWSESILKEHFSEILFRVGLKSHRSQPAK